MSKVTKQDIADIRERVDRIAERVVLQGLDIARLEKKARPSPKPPLVPDLSLRQAEAILDAFVDSDATARPAQLWLPNPLWDALVRAIAPVAGGIGTMTPPYPDVRYAHLRWRGVVFLPLTERGR